MLYLCYIHVMRCLIMDYSIKIKELREKLIISQKDLAEILNVSVVTVNRWENSKFEPTLKAKRSLNELFIKYEIK